jgi:hypothetical protein
LTSKGNNIYDLEITSDLNPSARASVMQLCKASFGQTFGDNRYNPSNLQPVSTELTCQAGKPACIGYEKNQNSEKLGVCSTTSEDIRGVNECAYNYGDDNNPLNNHRCPKFQPHCKYHIGGKQWGKCFHQR